jgi:hypothetical protein
MEALQLRIHQSRSPQDLQVLGGVADGDSSKAS